MKYPAIMVEQHHNLLITNSRTPAPLSLGLMYEAGKYPGRHRLFIHKKLVNPAPSVDNVAMWVMQPRVPEYAVYYFSSLYYSHISAILNSNDPLRGPPAARV